MMNNVYDFDKSVSLFYENDSHRGPGKVAQNLILGLKKIGISLHSQYDSRQPWKYSGYLQNCHFETLSYFAETKRPVLMGPNLFVVPTDNPYICTSFKNFVVPSNWVKDFYQTFDLMKDKNIFSWSVGIDTDTWNFGGPITNDPLDCFIYFKNRSKQDLAIVEAICKKFKLKYEILRYGSYKEEDLWRTCLRTKANKGFAILLTGTESQGIAYMQILSCDIPCYVFNNPTWKSEDGKYTAPATSVPYWDPRCGYITDNVNFEHFNEFLAKLHQPAAFLGPDKIYQRQFFKPREYILENHTLEISAKKYYDLLCDTFEQ